MKWRELSKRVTEVLEQGADKAKEWQVVTDVGGWKHATTACGLTIVNHCTCKVSLPLLWVSM